MRGHLPVLTFKNNYDSLVAAFIGGLFIFILTRYHGVGISPDSVSYASVARNLCKGRGLLEFNDNPLIIFPAGYPVFLASFSFLFNTDAQAIAPLINAFLAGLVIFVTGCIVQQFARNNRWYKWAMLSILPCSYTLLDVYTMLWSETFFIVLVFFFIVYFRRYLINPTLTHLLLPVLLTSIACDTRIAGISILATGMLLIFLHVKLLWDKKLMHLVVYATLGITLLLINLVRNQQENGTMTGIRQKSVTPLWLNIQYFGETVLQWFQLPNNNASMALAVGIVILITLVALFLYHYISGRQTLSFQVISISFCLIYISFIILTASISKYEKINNRLLSAAFIPLLVSISFWIPSAIIKLKKGGKRMVAIAFLALLFIIFQFRQVAAAIDLNNQYKDSGIPGYTELDWQESDIVQFLEKQHAFFKPDNDIYSNACDAVYFYGGLPAIALPEPAHKADLIDYYTSDPSYIVWFTNDFCNNSIIPLTEIEKHRHLDTLARFNDAIIFWSVEKKD